MQGLNVGGGDGSTMEICLRLRPASSPDSFLPYESVLMTMLHELAHNIHGPHAAPFYKLLDELTKECEELMAKGIGGGNFDGPSAGRVGGKNAGRELSSFDRRQAALCAAEERARKQSLMPSGPRKLGGDASLRDLPPALAAAAAAERRSRDNKWCPTEMLSQQVADHPGESIDAALNAVLSGRFGRNPPASTTSNSIRNNNITGPANRNASNGITNEVRHGGVVPPVLGEGSNGSGSGITSLGRKRPLGDIVEEIIDLTDDVPLEESILISSHIQREPTINRISNRDSTREDGSWTCPACTFLNSKPLALQCEICLTVRPAPDVRI